MNYITKLHKNNTCNDYVDRGELQYNQVYSIETNVDLGKYIPWCNCWRSDWSGRRQVWWCI